MEHKGTLPVLTGKRTRRGVERTLGASNRLLASQATWDLDLIDKAVAHQSGDGR